MVNERNMKYKIPEADVRLNDPIADEEREIDVW